MTLKHENEHIIKGLVLVVVPVLLSALLCAGATHYSVVQQPYVRPMAGASGATVTNAIASFETTESWLQGTPSADNNWTNAVGWTSTMTRVTTTAPLRFPWLNGSARGAWLRNGTNSFGAVGQFVSPILPIGCGTFSFEQSVRTVGWSCDSYVDVASDAAYTNWQQVAGPITTTFAQVITNVTTIANYGAIRIRIRRTDTSAGDLSGLSDTCLDNLKCTTP